MTKNLKYFLIPFLLGLPFWWGANIILSQDQTLPPEDNADIIKLIRNNSTPYLEIQAKSALSIFVDNNWQSKVLFEKEKNLQVPIASLTKLMTAKIILENGDLFQIVKISEKAAGFPGNGALNLKAGESFRKIDLLYPALMESNNTAIYALSESVGLQKIVELMNSEAKELGMENTVFLNPSGLDEQGQYSTADDVAKLAKSLLKNESFIWNIVSLKKADLYSAAGQLLYQVQNTNELLNEIPLIVGGKTGETKGAGGCLLLVLKAPKSRGYIINVILDSPDRFQEIKKLIEWDKNAYDW